MIDYIIGIDPGVDGAVAILSDKGPVVWDIPTLPDGPRRAIDAHELEVELNTLMEDGECHVFLERVNAQPKFGAASSFSFGRSYGTILGILAVLHIPHDLVSPAKWKKCMGVGSNKDVCRATAKRLFPMLAADLGNKKDEHKAEALLIAEFGRRGLG